MRTLNGNLAGRAAQTERTEQLEALIPKQYSNEELKQISLCYRICHDVTGSWSQRSLMDLRGPEMSAALELAKIN